MDYSFQTPASNARGYFGIDFAIAFLVTIIATILFGMLGILKMSIFLSAVLMLSPSIVVLIFRFMKSRAVSWGSVAVGVLVFLFLWFIQGLGSALNGM